MKNILFSLIFWKLKILSPKFYRLTENFRFPLPQKAHYSISIKNTLSLSENYFCIFLSTDSLKSLIFDYVIISTILFFIICVLGSFFHKCFKPLNLFISAYFHSIVLHFLQKNFTYWLCGCVLGMRRPCFKRFQNGVETLITIYSGTTEAFRIWRTSIHFKR